MTDVHPDDQIPAGDRAADDAVPAGGQDVAGQPVGAGEDQEETLVDAVTAEDEDDPEPAGDPDPQD